jgi:hypothetical protein
MPTGPRGASATGRPGRNLDPHLCDPEQLLPLLLHGAATPQSADVAIIEGVMGLFDGQIGGDGFASTAHVAALIQAPVIMVLDISQVSRTAAAIVHGLHTFDPAVRLSGVILNKAGSVRHADEPAGQVQQLPAGRLQLADQPGGAAQALPEGPQLGQLDRVDVVVGLGAALQDRAHGPGEQAVVQDQVGEDLGLAGVGEAAGPPLATDLEAVLRGLGRGIDTESWSWFR